MKKIKYLLLFVAMSFLGILNANAATGSIKASTNARTVAVGSTFTVTVNVNCSEALGSWQFGISYDSSYVSLQSGDTSVAAYGDGSIKSKTYTYKFKAIKSGKAGIRVTGPLMVTWNDVNTLFTPSSSGASVTVKTQAEIEASYSKDNNLKSLLIDGYTLSPAFDKNTTQYKVEVPDDVTSIKVSAKVNDSTARVSGTGTIDISEGINKVEVVVTAQNGATKTYVIEVDVKDLTPINVTIDNTMYTVVKKSELLSSPTGYNSIQIKINDIDVPAFYSDITKFTIVGLKDENGTIGLYIYDETQNTYTKYDEIKGVSLTLYPKDGESILENFSKTQIDINGITYNAYQNNIDNDLILIYALNVETGEKGYYSYNKKENSFQSYNSKIYENLETQNKEFRLYLLVLIAVCTILFLITITLSAKNKKIKKLCLKYANKNKTAEFSQIEEKEINSKSEIEEQKQEEVDEDFLGEKKGKRKKKK